MCPAAKAKMPQEIPDLLHCYEAEACGKSPMKTCSMDHKLQATIQPAATLSPWHRPHPPPPPPPHHHHHHPPHHHHHHPPHHHRHHHPNLVIIAPLRLIPAFGFAKALDLTAELFFAFQKKLMNLTRLPLSALPGLCSPKGGLGAFKKFRMS